MAAGQHRGARQRLYGEDLADHFWLEEQKFHVARTLNRGVLAVTQIKSDMPTPEPTQPVAHDEAHLVGFQVWNSPGHELWLEGKAVKSEPFKIGETAFYDLRRAPRAYMPHAFHSLQFYLPHAALREIAEQHDRRFNGDLRTKYGFAESDFIVQHLGTAVLPALERGEAIDGLFLDHILHAMAAHVVNTYSDSAFGLRRAAGGLASWQERRAKELMRSRIGADISLKELADACGLSVTHFARAFRQSASTSPHRWLREQRIEKAMALLLGSGMALKDIALACGFADQSHFTRVFSRQVGTSPAQWRKQSRQ